MNKVKEQEKIIHELQHKEEKLTELNEKQYSSFMRDV